MDKKKVSLLFLLLFIFFSILDSFGYKQLPFPQIIKIALKGIPLLLLAGYVFWNAKQINSKVRYLLIVALVLGSVSLIQGGFILPSESTLVITLIFGIVIGAIQIALILFLLFPKKKLIGNKVQLSTIFILGTGFCYLFAEVIPVAVFILILIRMLQLAYLTFLCFFRKELSSYFNGFLAFYITSTVISLYSIYISKIELRYEIVSILYYASTLFFVLAVYSDAQKSTRTKSLFSFS